VPPKQWGWQTIPVIYFHHQILLQIPSSDTGLFNLSMYSSVQQMLHSGHLLWSHVLHTHTFSLELLSRVQYSTDKLRLVNPLNTELNPICHLLALLEAHHILHVSRIWLTFTRKSRFLFVMCIYWLHSFSKCTHNLRNLSTPRQPSADNLPQKVMALALNPSTQNG
jgi:hypothetical protein